MQNITLPPTRLDVVAETMRRTLKVAEECGERFIAVTYDLAVAKPALQIQAAESPTFDNLFICFGAFHICLAYFGSLGHFLEGSGGPEILTESGVLAQGSLLGFLKGKHYNRCNRIHQILFCALQGLHFKKFLSEEGQIPEGLLVNMNRLISHSSTANLMTIESSSEYLNVMTRYEAFANRTLEGEHGNTAKYWMQYMKLVSVYLKFSRASRTNNLQLFIDALKDMCPIFFAMNRPNYARWMVRYYLNLINVDETHPGMKSVLERGALSVRRTDKNFARTAVDMTLELTINADAASRQTGIVAFNNSESARKRWMLTRSMRSCIVGGLMEKAGLKTTDDTAGTLRASRIRRDNEDIQNLVDKIETTMNPFNMEHDENSYCLTTGKQCHVDTRNDLLACTTIGEKWKDEFLNGCLNDPSRFEKAIPRRKVRNFASDALKTKVTSKDRKMVELQGTRDLFGRLLFISTINNIDLYKVFQYPLLPVPLSLGHIDGSVNKTDKSVLMRKLDTMCGESSPTTVDATFVDAVFFLHTLTSIPQTMGELSRMILQSLCNMSVLVHFVCDTYITPSIKEIERARRGQSDNAYSMIGKGQKTPTKWQQALQSPSFKTALFRFLHLDWQSSAYVDILRGHEVYLGFDNKCGYFAVCNDEVCYDQKEQYCCQHEEADTRLIYHLHVCLQEHNNNLSCVLRSNDTDVLVLLLYHLSILRVSDVWMDVGLSGKNTRRFVHVGCTDDKIGAKLANALLGIHAFTGCDYTASFMGKGKIKPLDMMLKCQTHIEAFCCLGESLHVSDGTMQTLESFVCTLYGKPALSDVNMVRYTMFREKYSFSANSPLVKIKGLNPETMPPCQKVLREKVKRSNYITAIWKNARKRCPVEESPHNNGWSLDQGSYCMKWFDGDQVPESIVDLLVSEAVPDQIAEDNLTNEIGHGFDSSDSETDNEED